MASDYSDQHCAEVLAAHRVASPDDALIWRDKADGGPLILIKARAPNTGVYGLIVEVEAENLALVRYLLERGTVETNDPSIFAPASARPV